MIFLILDWCYKVDEEFNPLAQYDDLEAAKSLEVANKQVVRMKNHNFSVSQSDALDVVLVETRLCSPSPICT